MNNKLKKYIWIVFVLVLLCLAFVAGRLSETLQASLLSEASYPWDLHRKIAVVDIQCNTLLAETALGKFFVKPVDDGATLIIATFDETNGLVTAHAIDVTGRIATDSWILVCDKVILE